MSKSLGNAISPEDILKKYGADILRVWVAASNYAEDLRIDYAWGGNVAVTIYRIPQLGKLTENIFYSQGYSGHGVAPTHMAAKVIANAISNEWDMIDTLSRIKHIQLPGGKWFSSPAMALGMAFYRLKDLWASKS